jgi:hypothetical protein
MLQILRALRKKDNYGFHIRFAYLFKLLLMLKEFKLSYDLQVILFNRLIYSNII